MTHARSRFRIRIDITTAAGTVSQAGLHGAIGAQPTGRNKHQVASKCRSSSMRRSTALSHLHALVSKGRFCQIPLPALSPLDIVATLFGDDMQQWTA